MVLVGVEIAMGVGRGRGEGRQICFFLLFCSFMYKCVRDILVISPCFVNFVTGKFVISRTMRVRLYLPTI